MLSGLLADANNLCPAVCPSAAALLHLQPGLLSQAFRGGTGRGAFGRAISLSNLLDAPAEHTGLFGSLSSSLGTSSSLQKRPTGSGDSTPTAAAAAAGGPFDEGESKKWRKKQPPQWGSKNNVIELLNELIDELDGIEQQIAQQAVEHIHANEVSLGQGWLVRAVIVLAAAESQQDVKLEQVHVKQLQASEVYNTQLFACSSW